MTLTLHERLATSLPKEVRLLIHHCSAVPTTADPLFVAAPGAKPEATELESHFLSASVQTSDGAVQAFAIEVLAYTTATLTTLFVSKADSTGYLHLLSLPTGTASPIRAVLTQFLMHLIDSKRQRESRLVLSLFARAQDQYLFPGSIENAKKHVLDDRGLIKWWAKILNQVFARYEANSSPEQGSRESSIPHRVRGHLVIPGIDAHEAKSFLPRSTDYKTPAYWHVSDPLASLGMPEGVPERCLIPRFPDDPKARFAVDLDDELPEPPKEGEQGQVTGPGQGQGAPGTGKWRSVRSLAQFWELMSFRQECSAGRVVGFLWGIWEPESLVGKPHQATVQGDDRLSGQAESNGGNGDADAQDRERHVRADAFGAGQSTIEPDIASRNAPSTTEVSQQVAPQVQRPVADESGEEAENAPPPADAVQPQDVPPLIKQTPSQVVLSADAYARSMELLLTLDYCDLPTAIDSTQKLLSAIGKEGGKQEWGIEVIGRQESAKIESKAAAGEVNSLAGLVRKRPKAEANTLSAGLIRKKPKT